MQGVSRTSLTEVIRRLDDILPSANTATLGHELFEVVALLDQEHSLRRWLADPAGSPDAESQRRQGVWRPSRSRFPVPDSRHGGPSHALCGRRASQGPGTGS